MGNQSNEKTINQDVGVKKEKVTPVKSKDAKSNLEKTQSKKKDKDVVEKLNRIEKYTCDEEKLSFDLIDNIYQNYKLVSSEFKKDFDKLTDNSKKYKELAEKTIVKIEEDYTNANEMKAKEYKAIVDKAQKVYEDRVEKQNAINISIEKKMQEDLAAFKPRAKDIKEKIEQEKQTYKIHYDKAINKINKFREESLAQYNKALEDEKNRLIEVEKELEKDKSLLEEKYIKASDAINAEYDNDISALNKQIKKMHVEYQGRVESLKARYSSKFEDINKKIEKAKADTGQKIKNFEDTLKSESKRINDKISSLSSDDKSSNRALTKELKVIGKQSKSSIIKANKELSKALAQWEKEKEINEKEKVSELKQLEQEFIQLVPPVENKIRKRKYRYDVDILREKNIKQKNDNDYELRVFVDKSINAIKNSTIERDYKIAISEYDNKEIVVKAKLDLDKKLKQYDLDVFQAGEECKLNEINLQKEFDKISQDIELKKIEEERENIIKVANINNNYSQLDLKLDKRYRILSERIEKVLECSNIYYNILNKRNGVSTKVFDELNSNIDNDMLAGMTLQQSYEMLNKNLDTYVLDTKENKDGILSDKITSVEKNQKEILNIIKAKYEIDKKRNETMWKDELNNQENKYNYSISSFDKELADNKALYDDSLNQAKNELQKKLDDLLMGKNVNIKTYNDAKATADKNHALYINKQNNLVDDEQTKYDDQEKLLKEKASNIIQELDANLNDKAIDQEKLNIDSDRLTEKIIRYLLKNGSINPKSRWWVVEL